MTVETDKAVQEKSILGWNYTYNWAKPYFKNSINAIDVGCREGEFARLMEQDFAHIYCYDFRPATNFYKLFDIGIIFIYNNFSIRGYKPN